MYNGKEALGNEDQVVENGGIQHLSRNGQKTILHMLMLRALTREMRSPLSVPLLP